MDEPLASIVVRSCNEGWALRETLPALKAQNYRNWELIVIDSGSTDGSVELIRGANPQHFIQIRKEDYNPSRVMNHGMELASAGMGIFLNADATPQGDNWLRPLVMHLLEPSTAAVLAGKFHARTVRRCMPAITSGALVRIPSGRHGNTFSAWSAAGSGKTFGPSEVFSRTCNIRKTTNTRAGARPRDTKLFIVRNRWSCTLTTIRASRRIGGRSEREKRWRQCGPASQQKLTGCARSCLGGLGMDCGTFGFAQSTDGCGNGLMH